MSPRDTDQAGNRHRMFDTSFLILAALTTLAAIAVAITKGPGRVIEITAQYLGFLLLLTPKILCGFFIAAAVALLIPRSTMTKWVGAESGTKGLIVATLTGALVPGGPTMIFPLAAGFRASGASLATLIAFVTSWSLLGINRTVIWEMSFLHIDVVGLRVLLCLPLPILVGWVAGRVLR
ncbi:MAG: hypothetical protein AAFU41_05625 [Pseudomonadota bacterium]